MPSHPAFTGMLGIWTHVPMLAQQTLYLLNCLLRHKTKVHFKAQLIYITKCMEGGGFYCVLGKHLDALMPVASAPGDRPLQLICMQSRSVCSTPSILSTFLLHRFPNLIWVSFLLLCSTKIACTLSLQEKKVHENLCNVGFLNWIYNAIHNSTGCFVFESSPKTFHSDSMTWMKRKFRHRWN